MINLHQDQINTNMVASIANKQKNWKQVFGSITKPLIETLQSRDSKPASPDSAESPEFLRFLLLEDNTPTNQSNNQTSQRRSRISMLMSYPTTTVHYFWRRFDNRFMRPVFGGSGFIPFFHASSFTEIEEISWNTNNVAASIHFFFQ